MRGAFGLVSLLICVAIVAYLWASHTSAISKTGAHATDEATQLSGHDANGESALKSITTEDNKDAAGHLKGLLVTDIVPGGAMDKFYAFKKGDVIITEGEYEVGINDDGSTASAMLLRAFEGFQSVVVIRDGEHVTLPLAAPAGSTQPASAGKTLQDQVNQLEKLSQP